MKMFSLFLFFPYPSPMVPRILFSRMRSFTRCLLGQRLSVCACCTVSLSLSSQEGNLFYHNTYPVRVADCAFFRLALCY